LAGLPSVALAKEGFKKRKERKHELKCADEAANQNQGQFAQLSPSLTGLSMNQRHPIGYHYL
jgi:hypothetical protein